MSENQKPRSADVLVNTAIETPGVMDQLKAHPEETLKKLAEQSTQQVPAYVPDTWIYRMVVGSLGFVCIAVVVGSIGLAFVSDSSEAKIPDILTALGSAAIGALAGILAPSPSSK